MNGGAGEKGGDGLLIRSQVTLDVSNGAGQIWGGGGGGAASFTTSFAPASTIGGGGGQGQVPGIKGSGQYQPVGDATSEAFGPGRSVTVSGTAYRSGDGGAAGEPFAVDGDVDSLVRSTIAVLAGGAMPRIALLRIAPRKAPRTSVNA